MVKKNTYLKEAQGDGVMVVVMEVDDEEEDELLLELMTLWWLPMEMKEVEDEGKRLE